MNATLGFCALWNLTWRNIIRAQRMVESLMTTVRPPALAGKVIVRSGFFGVDFNPPSSGTQRSLSHHLVIRRWAIESFPAKHAIGLQNFFPAAVMVFKIPKLGPPDNLAAGVGMEGVRAFLPGEHHCAVVIPLDEGCFLHMKKLCAGREDRFHLLDIVIGQGLSIFFIRHSAVPAHVDAL